MSLPLRILGLVIAACGLALCHGAVQWWPAGISSSSLPADVVRIAGASIVAILGIANVAAGLVAAFAKPMRAE